MIRNNGYLETFGYKLNLSSPNPGGFFSPSSKASDASWQAVRASGGAFAAVASNGQIGLWGDPATGAIPANPQLTQRLLEQHPATQIYNNAGAFVALSDNGTAISWGDAATGGDHNGAPLIFGDIDHLVSPWQNMRIDELGQGLLSLIANGKPNPEGQSSPLRVQEAIGSPQRSVATPMATAATPRATSTCGSATARRSAIQARPRSTSTRSQPAPGASPPPTTTCRASSRPWRR